MTEENNEITRNVSFKMVEAWKAVVIFTTFKAPKTEEKEEEEKGEEQKV